MPGHGPSRRNYQDQDHQGIDVEKSPFNKVHWVTDPFVESAFH